jgi:hypothetical protein
MKSQGLESEGHKERIDQLKGQAQQARDDRDQDRWLAAAQGFFAMGAGRSQYAMQNMAEGLGIGTKQLQSVEKEYRAGEKARLDSIAALKQAERAEKLGNFDQAVKFQEKREDLEQKRVQHQDTVKAQLMHTAAGIVNSRDDNKTRLEAARINYAAHAANRPFDAQGDIARRYEAIQKLPPEQRPAAMKQLAEYQQVVGASGRGAYGADIKAGGEDQRMQMKVFQEKVRLQIPTITALKMGNAENQKKAAVMEAALTAEQNQIMSGGAAPAADAGAIDFSKLPK